MKTAIGILALAMSIAAGAGAASAMPTDIESTDWRVEAFNPEA